MPKTKKNASPSLRAAIMAAAAAAGIANANQFYEKIAGPLGFTRSHAIRFYEGTSDFSTARADLLLQKLGLTVNPTDAARPRQKP